MSEAKLTATSLDRKVEALINSIDRVQPSMRKYLWRSFLHGLMTGLGATIGLSIALAILAYILGALQIIPGLGELIQQSSIRDTLPDDPFR